MNHIKPYRSFVLENAKPTKFGYVKLQLEPITMQEIHKMISPEDLDAKGLEEDTHLTLLYGLHPGVTPEQVSEKLKGINFSRIRLENISIFDQGSREVLKFDVTGWNLLEANSALKELPNTSDFPDFHPHTTIAYLKPGTSNKYLQLLNGKSFDLKATEVFYKDADKNIYKIK